MLKKTKVNLKKSYTIYPDDVNNLDGVHAYFQNIIDVLPNNVYWLDRNCVTLGCNRNVLDLIGLKSLDEFVGLTYEEMGRLANWTEGQAQSFKRDDMEVMATGKPKINVEEPPLYDAEGNKIHYISTRVPLFDSAGTVIGVVGTSIDITYRVKIEEELKNAKIQAEASNKAKTAFLENMRHDIYTPLTGILGLSRMITQQTQETRTREHAHLLLSAGQAMTDFLKEVLEMIRLTDGKMPITNKKFQLKLMLEALLALSKPKAVEKGLLLQFNYDDALPEYIVGDSARLYRILLEFLSNALLFTDQGQVLMSVKLGQKTKDKIVVIFEVTDTGIGMEQTHLDDIFGSFQRLSPSHQGVHTGAGLGLTVVRQFINDMEGEVFAQSIPGEGSTFVTMIPFNVALLQDASGVYARVDQVYKDFAQTKFLPMSKVTFDRVNKPETKTETLPKLPSTRILLVEDQRTAAIVVRSSLEDLNCLVDWVENGQDALNIVKSDCYELIFMDIGLPDISGLDVTAQIRVYEKNNNRRSVPIIALTAHVDEETQQSCLDMGMVAVVNKPTSPEKLEVMLNAFIPGRAEVGGSGYRADLIPGLPVIDLLRTQKCLGCDESTAKKYLAMFVASLGEEKRFLKNAHSTRNWDQLAAVVHKLKGGASYCGVPQFEMACQGLEAHLKLHAREEIELYYQQLITAIKTLKNAWKSAR